jgi:hypothetical protein
LGSNDEGLLMNVVGGPMTRWWLLPTGVRKKMSMGRVLDVNLGCVFIRVSAHTYMSTCVLYYVSKKTLHCVGFPNLTVDYLNNLVLGILKTLNI